MATEIKSHFTIALQSASCFSNDGKIDSRELNYLLDLAKADGVIDPDERRVLANILNHAMACPLDEATLSRIEEIRAELEI
ncbi:hypothetical protein IB286_10670 [Spongiibacter sp. KMU-158]|uniref:Tellurite resistance protein TerB n=1 Tax=Spongiibacter pelagi TaxID=2760804 RepID=A0A927C425_9GAMM|nr:hypothetical protein [Spongiibacter pelagi]MBD2859467.1 hypothetical protein [Spongiibacter pelagi]